MVKYLRNASLLFSSFLFLTIAPQKYSFAANSAPVPTGYTVKASGNSWKLLAPDTNKNLTSNQNNNLVIIENKEGLVDAPLPKSTKAELAADKDLFPDASKTVSGVGQTQGQVIVHQGVAEAMDDGTLETKYADFRETDPEDGPQGVRPLFGFCKAKWYSKGKSGTVNLGNLLPSSNTSFNSGNFKGTFSVNAPATGKVDYEFRFAYKALSCFKVPYAFRFENVRTSGEVDFRDTLLSLDGSFAATTGWESNRIRIFKQTFDFWLGPIPVHLGLKLDTFYGYDASVKIAGTLALANAATGKYKFDYTCTTDNCSGQHTSTVQFPNPNAGLRASATIDATVAPYLGLEFTGYAYTESLLSGGFGTEFSAPVNGWGIVTNICEDGDGDGKNELLSSLVLDVNAQLALYGKWTLFSKTRTGWFDLNVNLPGWTPVKTSNIQGRNGSREFYALQRNLYFNEFHKGDASAFSPIIKGGAIAEAGDPTSYSASLRSCVPARFKNKVSYAMNWGDGSYGQLTSSASEPVSASHSWASAGPKTITFTAQSDGQGRKLNTSTSRTINVTESTSLPKVFWAGLPALNTAGNSTQSIRSVRTHIAGGNLYVFIDTQGSNKSYSLYINTDGNSLTGHQAPNWNASSGAEVLIQNGQQFNSTGPGWAWTDSGYRPKVVMGEKYFEFTIPLASIGLQPNGGANMSLGFGLVDATFNLSEKLPIGNAFVALNGSIPESAPVSFWAGITPIATASGQNANSIKATIRNGYLYVLVEGSKLGNSYALMLNTDGNKTTGHQSIVWTTNSGADFMFSNGFLYRSTGSTTDWKWEQLTANIGVTLIDQSIEIRIPLTKLNLANTVTPNVSLGFHLSDSKFQPFSKLPTGTAFLPVKDVSVVSPKK